MDRSTEGHVLGLFEAYGIEPPAAGAEMETREPNSEVAPREEPAS